MAVRNACKNEPMFGRPVRLGSANAATTQDSPCSCAEVHVLPVLALFACSLWPVPMTFRQTHHLWQIFLTKLGGSSHDPQSPSTSLPAWPWRSKASVACHARLTLIMPVAYRHIICFSRAMWCKSCASDRSMRERLLSSTLVLNIIK